MPIRRPEGITHRRTIRTRNEQTGAYVQPGIRHARAKRIAGVTEPWPEFDANLDAEVENLLDQANRDLLDTQKGYTLGQGRNGSLQLAAPLVLHR